MVAMRGTTGLDMATDEREKHGLGILLTTASAIAYSTAGFFTRLIHLDVWTVLFWRGIFAGLFITCFIVWQNRRATLAGVRACLLYTSPSPRDLSTSRMPSSA